MIAGYYVVHRTEKGQFLRLHSRPFVKDLPGVPEGFALRSIEQWRDFVQTEHPDKELFIIEVLPNKAPPAPV